MPQSSQSTIDRPPGTGSETKAAWFSIVGLERQLENLSQRIESWALHDSPFECETQYDQLFDALARGLYRRSPRHMVVRRERGVGDHAVLVELVRKASVGDYPHLTNTEFVRLDCRFLPPEHSREFLQLVFSNVRPDIVLCIDGLATTLAAGGQQQNRGLLLSLLDQTPCRVIGLVTPQEFEEHFAGRPDTDEFFSPIEMNEPSPETAVKLSRHFANGLAQQYGMKINDEAVRKAVLLSHTYIPSSRLPAKAIRVLSDVCDDLAFDRSQGQGTQNEILEEHIISRVSEISGVPAGTLAGLPDGVDYQEALGSRIVGQDHVIEEVATELGLIRAGMIDTGKPASVMLFVGQTGTGKTELAKVVAQLYSASKRLKTFTLGNYSEPHSVSGIIGVPAGYVGHELGGRLVNELNTDPYSVFLLDEADKAHPDVMQPFLNLFDEGWIVDQRGVKGYAERAIFILTTNVGQRQIAEMQKKGKSWDEIHEKLMESLSQIRHAKANRPVFSAEFLARLKRVIIFKPLDADAMAGITRQLIDDLVQKWASERHKELAISDAVAEMISTQAQEQNEKSKGKKGGRIVRKLIANLVEAGLQNAIARQPERYRIATQVLVEREPGDDATGVEIRFD